MLLRHYNEIEAAPDQKLLFEEMSEDGMDVGEGAALEPETGNIPENLHRSGRSRRTRKFLQVDPSRDRYSSDVARSGEEADESDLEDRNLKFEIRLDKFTFFPSLDLAWSMSMVVWLYLILD